MINEDTIELLALDWFEQINWKTIKGDNIAPNSSNPMRTKFDQVILEDELFEAFKRINFDVPKSEIETCFDQVKAQLFANEHIDLLAKNRSFYRSLIQGYNVTYKVNGEIKNTNVFLIDFNHPNLNRFLAVNQFTVDGKRKRRPDIVCFINGLPIAVIELKNPTNEKTDMQEAFNQIQTYKAEISDLFIFNQAVVISDGINARIGSLTANEERFMPWRTIEHEKHKPLLEWRLETLIKGFFEPSRLLDYIRYFIIFESDVDKIIKKIAGYHQFHAVREAVRATIYASSECGTLDSKLLNNGREVQLGSKKAGVVWHTQGSGKSISMCCYVGMLKTQPEMRNPTIVVVTDRNDLDGQLFATFSSAEDLLGTRPSQAQDRDDLRIQLSERDAGGIIFTTVHKFGLLTEEKHHPILNNRHNIVVISDEAHRSQYGLTAKLKDDQYKFGYAKHLRDALPNATFIGFTGTPVSLEDRDTRAVFGDYVSIYDIQDAVDDGATVQIFYEARLAKLNINQAEIDSLSEQVEEIIEEEEDTKSKEKTKSEWTRLEKLVGAEPRLAQVAEDLINHFELRNSVLEGKGMIVCMSREICIQLYNQIIALRPDLHDEDPHKGGIKIIMTGSASDKEHFRPHLYSKEDKKLLERRFKDPNDPLKLVIVRDMWLTGFDAPSCHTMYIDKPMKGHNLMQAIARVNRVFKDKTNGLVVDYIGIGNELKQALKHYTNSNGAGKPTVNTAEAFAIFLEKLDALRGMFAKSPQGEGFEIKDFENNAAKLLLPAANYILGLPDGKKRFLDLVLATTKAYSICNTIDEAKPYKIEVAFYSAIKTAFSKFSTDTVKRTQDQKDSLLKQILDNAVVAEGVTDLYDLCGLEKPNIALLSDEFLDDVKDLPQKNVAIEILNKLIQDKIRSHMSNNVVQEKMYGERLQETLRKYNNKAIESVKVIEELIAMAKEIQENLKRRKDLNLNDDEIAFYDALATNESAVRELEDETLKAIARELTQKLKASTKVDWQKRDSVRAELRIMIRNILRKYKYPPDKSNEATDLILEQTEVLADDWSFEDNK